MKTATLVHVETGVEFYRNGALFNPSANEKLIWAIYSMPNDVERIEQTFETEIDEIVGFSKREVEAKIEQNFKSGVYNFLPAIGFNQNVIVKW